MDWLTPAIFLLLPAIAYTARRSSGSWLAPAAFFAGFWSVFAGLPLIAGPISVAPAGMVFLAAACAAVLLGAWLAQRRRHVAAAREEAVAEPPAMGWFVAGCTVVGIAVVLLTLRSAVSAGYGPHGISVSALATSIHKLAIARNGGTWQEPAAARVLTTATYLGALLSGLMLGIRTSGRARWLSLLVLAPSVAITVVLTTRSSLLIPLALAASAYLATCIAAGRRPTLTLKTAAGLSGLVVLLALGFVLILMARYSGSSSGRPVAAVQALWLDTFPYLGVFSTWLQSNGVSASPHPTLGQYTFAGVFDLLHIHSRVAGLYTDQVVVGGTNYNIYTVFRGLVEDFTIPGALLVLGLVGFGVELAYERAQSGHLPSAGVLAAFYAATLWSFVVNIFIYNSIVLAFVVLIGYLAVASIPSLRKALVRIERPRPVSKEAG